MSPVSTSLNIHRLLDEAFAGVEVTAEIQDLKEEMRGNLVARVAELEAAGVLADEAARRAMTEVGDVRAVVEEMGQVVGPASPRLTQRVRPRPAYVVRTVLFSLAGLAGLATLWLLAMGAMVGPRPVLDRAVLTVVVALIGAALTGDALRQETTTNYPVTRARATGYSGSTAFGLGALGADAAYISMGELPWLLTGIALALTSIVGFTYLLATQTNRHKPWAVRERRRQEEAMDRFTQDPASAARFGIYTVAIGLITLAAFTAVGFTAGWFWSWAPLVVGGAIWFLVLARMLFGAEREPGAGLHGGDAAHGATVRP